MTTDYRKQAERLAGDVDIPLYNTDQIAILEQALRQAADDARKEEREACITTAFAEDLEDLPTTESDVGYTAAIHDVVEAIRNRSTQENENGLG